MRSMVEGHFWLLAAEAGAIKYRAGAVLFCCWLANAVKLMSRRRYAYREEKRGQLRRLSAMKQIVVSSINLFRRCASLPTA